MATSSIILSNKARRMRGKLQESFLKAIEKRDFVKLESISFDYPEIISEDLILKGMIIGTKIKKLSIFQFLFKLAATLKMDIFKEIVKENSQLLQFKEFDPKFYLLFMDTPSETRNDERK